MVEIIISLVAGKLKSSIIPLSTVLFGSFTVGLGRNYAGSSFPLPQLRQLLINSQNTIRISCLLRFWFLTKLDAPEPCCNYTLLRSFESWEWQSLSLPSRFASPLIIGISTLQKDVQLPRHVTASKETIGLVFQELIISISGSS